MTRALPDRRTTALLTEAVLWVGPPGIFLYLYISRFGASPTVVLPHLIAVTALWLGIAGFRLLNWRFMPSAQAAKWLSTALLILPPATLSLWYASVLIGLASWGRVTTWPLMKTYLFQAGHLAGVLGLPAWSFLVAAALLVLPVALLRHALPRLDWSRKAAISLSGPGLLMVSALGIGVTAAQIMRLSSLTDYHPQEPLGISFFANRSTPLQSHTVATSPVIDAAEDKARSSYRETISFERRNVVLIVGDALRSDHMGIYGYARATTPLLEESTRRHQTLIASNPRSVCAESSCGLLAIASSRPLHLTPTRPFTLHEVLRQHGYRINLALSGDHTNFYGLKEAYGAFDAYFDGTLQDARYINDDLLLLDYVSSLPPYDGSQPVMFQFHLMSTHGLGLRHASEAVFQPTVNYYRWPPRRERTAPSPDEAPKAVNYYDNGVLQFDRIASRLLETLESKGYLSDAVVVITGDHGEMLGEKALFGHQHTVDEAVLRIPIVLQRRGYAGEPIGGWPLTSQIDIAPSILEELGIPAPASWLGRPLQSLAGPRIVHFQQAAQFGLYSAHDAGRVLKYWSDLSAGKEFLYDIQDDPGESRNLIQSMETTQLRSWRNEVITGSAAYRLE